MKPLDPRLLREARAARWFIAGVVVLATIGVLSTLVIAWHLTRFITQVFVTHANPVTVAGSLFVAGFFGLVKGITIWAQEALAARASASARQELRGKYLSALFLLDSAGRSPQDSTAARHMLANRGLDALDAYFAKYLPQLAFAAMVTPVFVLVTFMTDWLSGLILLLTIPLIPLFMAIIGWATRSVQQRQIDSLNRLSQHFIEVLRGLTTLKIYGREWAQIHILREVGEQYRRKTMKVLSVSFLSGFALELAASLSVALIAVSIGLRLMDGSLALSAGLFVLLLAPEAYLPLRMVGANFHAAAEGVQASAAVLDAIEAANLETSEQRIPAEDLPTRGALTVLAGPSGAGKSTLLKQYRNSFGLGQVAWMAQTPYLFEGTVLENLIGPGSARRGDYDSNALKDALTASCLDDLALEQQVGEAGSAISGGQRQRVALARAIYRLHSKRLDYLLLDEPISALDSTRAEAIVFNLKKLASNGVSVVAVSHQGLLIEAADSIVSFESQSSRRMT